MGNVYDHRFGTSHYRERLVEPGFDISGVLPVDRNEPHRPVTSTFELEATVRVHTHRSGWKGEARPRPPRGYTPGLASAEADDPTPASRPLQPPDLRGRDTPIRELGSLPVAGHAPKRIY